MSRNESNTRVLALLTSPNAHRNAAWAAEFEHHLARATFGGEGTMSGALGTCRFFCIPIATDQTSEASFDDIVRFVTDAGCGLSIPVNGAIAVQVEFGPLATYRMFQRWSAPPGWSGGPAPVGRQMPQQPGSSVETAAPNEEYLPQFVRAPIRAYLKLLGVSEPRVGIVRWPQNANHLDLAFNIPRAQFTPEAFTTAMRTLMWFLPQGYQCISWDSAPSLERSGAIL